VPLFGKKKLEPTQLADDARVFELLRSQGVDLTQPLQIWHYLYFKRESDARDVARQVGDSSGWGAEIRPAAKGPRWLLLLTHSAVIDLAVIESLNASLTAMPARMGGEYDGWEAGVPK